MRLLPTSFILIWLSSSLGAQQVPAGWKIVKDETGACQAAIPPDWQPGASPGIANPKDVTQGSLLITADPFTLKPMPEAMQKTMKIDTMIENTSSRVFYSTVSGKNGQSRQYSVSVPGRNGSCNSRVAFRAGVADQTARTIALSVGPAK